MITKQELSNELLETIKGKSSNIIKNTLGNGELKTKDKTIKGSINEILDNRENLRKSTIQKIKDRKISIDDNATWFDIIMIILQNKKEV